MLVEREIIRLELKKISLLLFEEKNLTCLNRNRKIGSKIIKCGTDNFF